MCLSLLENSLCMCVQCVCAACVCGCVRVYVWCVYGVCGVCVCCACVWCVCVSHVIGGSGVCVCVLRLLRCMTVSCLPIVSDRAATEKSKYFELGWQPHEFLTRNTCSLVADGQLINYSSLDFGLLDGLIHCRSTINFKLGRRYSSYLPLLPAHIRKKLAGADPLLCNLP